MCEDGGLVLLVNSATNDLYKPEPLEVILPCKLKLEGSAANVGMSLFKEKWSFKETTWRISAQRIP